jgi:hypothetical protein
VRFRLEVRFKLVRGPCCMNRHLLISSVVLRHVGCAEGSSPAWLGSANKMTVECLSSRARIGPF